MDPNPKSFPILSYVLDRLPSIGPKFGFPATSTDIEQPPSPPPSDPSETNAIILASMPHLSDPKVFASMRQAISQVSQTRSVLQTLGPRPDHESVDNARLKLSEIEASLSRQLEEIVRSSRPAEVDMREWRAHLADKEQECRQAAEKEKEKYKAVLQLEEMHDAYEKMLKDAEAKLVRIYEKAEVGDDEKEDEVVEIEETNEEITGILVEASSKVLERIDLSNRKLRLLPEAFGKISGLRVLILYNNQLQVIPDSISGLENLEELNVASNLLENLPDSIGLLQNLRILDVSSNKLEVLPDTICGCRSLVELDVSFNRLSYLPTNIGYELSNLQKLSIKLNKIRSLPSSIGEMKYLRYLDAHFNELHGLPQTIGKLKNLEFLDLSSNFNDLTELPETFGDLISLKELDLSNNQIHKLPDTFGRLDNLIKLNLDQNPLEVPPMDVVEKGVEAVKSFMAKRWLDILLEEERKSQLEVQEERQVGWLTRSTTLLKTYASSLSGYLQPKTPRDPYLDQQL